MAAGRDNRIDVLEAGLRGGWVHETDQYDGGNILADTFSSDVGIVRVV